MPQLILNFLAVHEMSAGNGSPARLRPKRCYGLACRLDAALLSSLACARVLGGTQT